MNLWSWAGYNTGVRVISEHRLLYMKLSANLKVGRHAVKVQRWHPLHIALGCFIHALHKYVQCNWQNCWMQYRVTGSLGASGAVCIYSLTQIHMIRAGQLAWFCSTIIFALSPASGLCMSSHAACLHAQSLFGMSDSLAWALIQGLAKSKRMLAGTGPWKC